MSLRIKLPKQTVQNAEAPRSSKPTKRRIDSDDDEEDLIHESDSDHIVSHPRIKRGRTEDSLEDRGAPSPDPNGEDEVDVDVDVEAEEDTRFLPPDDVPSVPLQPAAVRTSRSSRATGRSAASGSTKPPGRKQKRGPIVWTDSEDDGEFMDAGRLRDSEDEDFAPDHASTASRRTSNAPKPRNGKLTTGSRGVRGKSRKEEKEIVIRDERKLAASTSTLRDKQIAPGTSGKRTLPKDASEDMEIGTPSVQGASVSSTGPIELASKLDEPAPPKKRKLPPIKKNKTSTAPSTPSALKLPIKEVAVSGTSSSITTETPLRKPAATINNADFDLRDKSVYAQLFNKPGGTTPNSGLNRKEKEEERRKELNKMRDEARAKRAEEAKHTFDLQAAADKIARFEEKLRARKSMAAFPNILGGYFKGVYDEACRKESERRE